MAQTIPFVDERKTVTHLPVEKTPVGFLPIETVAPPLRRSDQHDRQSFDDHLHRAQSPPDQYPPRAGTTSGPAAAEPTNTKPASTSTDDQHDDRAAARSTDSTDPSDETHDRDEAAAVDQTTDRAESQTGSEDQPQPDDTEHHADLPDDEAQAGDLSGSDVPTDLAPTDGNDALGDDGDENQTAEHSADGNSDTSTLHEPSGPKNDPVGTTASPASDTSAKPSTPAATSGTANTPAQAAAVAPSADRPSSTETPDQQLRGTDPQSTDVAEGTKSVRANGAAAAADAPAELAGRDAETSPAAAQSKTKTTATSAKDVARSETESSTTPSAADPKQDAANAAAIAGRPTSAESPAAPAQKKSRRARDQADRPSPEPSAVSQTQTKTPGVSRAGAAAAIKSATVEATLAATSGSDADRAADEQSSAADDRHAKSTGAPSNSTSTTTDVTKPVSASLVESDKTTAPPRSDSADGSTRARFVQRVASAVRAANERGGEIRLRLSPPELGSLRVEIQLREGTLSARLQTETESARHMLLDNLPQLRERLQEQGIKVEQFNVDVRDESSSDPRGRQTTDRDGDNDAAPSAANRSNNAAGDAGGSEDANAPTTLRPTDDGRLNIVI